MFTAALFIITKTCKQPKSTDGCVNKENVRYTDTDIYLLISQIHKN